MVLAVGACGGNTATEKSGQKCADSEARGDLVVLAASSLQQVLDAIKPEYLKNHPCVTSLTFSYGSSATLASQIVNGSPADVFLSANSKTMKTVVANQLVVGEAVVFAQNKGEIMISAASPFSRKISNIQDLFSQQPEIQIGLCVASAPCGSLADTILINAQFAYNDFKIARNNIDSESPSVEDLVTKIKMGELDAGIVFHSDCVWAKKDKAASCVEIPSEFNGRELNTTSDYMVAAVSNKSLAQDFVQYVSSPSFVRALQREFGFLAP